MLKTITFHKRSTGKTGQILASPQIEKKLATVEKLYQQYHGVKMGRYKFYDICLTPSRETKKDAGGYIQHMGEAVAGVVLDHMHKQLSAALKRKARTDMVLEIGSFKIANLRDLAQGKRGRPRKVAV